MNSKTDTSIHPVVRIWAYSIMVFLIVALVLSFILFQAPWAVIVCLPLTMFTIPSLIGCLVFFKFILKSDLSYQRFLISLFIAFAIIVYLNVFLIIFLGSEGGVTSMSIIKDIIAALEIAAIPIIATWASMLFCLSEIRMSYLS